MEYLKTSLDKNYVRNLSSLGGGENGGRERRHVLHSSLLTSYSTHCTLTSKAYLQQHVCNSGFVRSLRTWMLLNGNFEM